jgi:predicted phosphodiesterase
MQRFAVVSDIHGNLPALEAVLADAARHRVEGVINLGDNLSGPLWPSETAHFMMKQDWLNVQGNHDWNLLHRDPVRLSLSDLNAYRALDEEITAWLSPLPARVERPEGILAFHGTPTIQNAYLLESIANLRTHLATPNEIDARLGEFAANLLLCGHSHFPRTVQHRDMLIVCPGSVGCPAYIDNNGSGHVIETGSPHARYAVIERQAAGWSVEQIALPYDTLSAVKKAAANGRPDWEIALRTGFMRVGDETPNFPGM